MHIQGFPDQETLWFHFGYVHDLGKDLLCFISYYLSMLMQDRSFVATYTESAELG